VVHEIAVGKIDDATPMDKVCIMSCEVPTGFGAVFNTAKVRVDFSAFSVTSHTTANLEPCSQRVPSITDKIKGIFSFLTVSFRYLTEASPLGLQVTPGSTCVVFGLGGIGSAIVIGCKASGASRILPVDINEKKFPWARDCLNPRNLEKPVQEVVKEMTGIGADFAFEATGLIDTMVCGLGAQ
jgi:Zn-dependent alcohol dehydrogenase